MKNSPSRLAIAATAAIAVLGFATPKAEAAGGERLISYAHALENTVVKLNVEIREHYSHTSIYRHMLSDTHHLYSEAKHIDQLAHNPYTSLIHLRTDVIEVEKHVEHLHDLIDGAERGRYGHVKGDTRHVHSFLDYMEKLVHSMEVEISNLQRMQQRGSHRGHSSHDSHRGHDSHSSRGGHDSHRGHDSHSSRGGRDDHHDSRHSRTDTRNINNYMGNQWNRSTQVQRQPVRIDARGLFNLFRSR